MSIVLSSNIDLVITTADTTNFDYGTNKATEISILKGIELNKSFISKNLNNVRVSATSNRAESIKLLGFAGVSFKFKTYLKPITYGANVTSPEKLLWESLSATDVVDTTTTSTVDFTSSNTNRLRELYFYILFEDGSYYKVSQGVVSGVEIDISLDKIATATWDVYALDVEYISTSTSGNPRLLTDRVFLKNKLSTISLTGNSKTYDLAILKSKIKIQNTVIPISRARVGSLQTPTGHYVASRQVSADISCYLNNKNLGSDQLLNDLLSVSSLTAINTLFNAGISIGGSNNDLRIDVNMPTSKLAVTKPTVGQTNTVDFILHPQESTLGSADEISLIYNN